MIKRKGRCNKQNSSNATRFSFPSRSTQSTSRATVSGMDEVTKKVYENAIPILTLAEAVTLKKWYRRMLFRNIIVDGINKYLENKYHRLVASMKKSLSN